MKKCKNLLLVLLMVAMLIPGWVKALSVPDNETLKTYMPVDQCDGPTDDGYCTTKWRLPFKLSKANETFKDGKIYVTLTPIDSKLVNNVRNFKVTSADSSKFVVEQPASTANASKYSFTITIADYKNVLNTDNYVVVAEVTFEHKMFDDDGNVIPGTDSDMLSCGMSIDYSTSSTTNPTKTGSFVSYVALGGIALACFVVYSSTTKKNRFN